MFFDTGKQAGRLALAILAVALGLAPKTHAQSGIPCTSCASSCTDEFPTPPGCKGPSCGAARAACIARCEQTCAKPAPPATIHPRYLILSLLYSPPGCTTSSADKCTPQGSVSYGDNSSTGTQVSASNSFQESNKTSVGTKEVWNASASFQITATSSTSETVTKTKGITLATQGTSDGVNHDLDTFVLFTDPVVNVQQTAASTLWSLAANGGSFNSLPITVADLKNPTGPAARQLTTLGLTSADFRTILAQDPFASPGSSVTLNRAVVRGPGVGQTGLPPAANSADPSQFPNRYAFTGMQLGYVPPTAGSCTNGVCPCVTTQYTISNALLGSGTTSYSTQYAVSLDIGGLPLKGVGLESNTTFTWTNTATQQNTNQNTQNATLTLACPSPNYTGPVEVDVWWDAVYGTFLFVPVVDTELVTIQQGVVTGAAGKPLAGEPVSLAFSGRTYRTFTDYRGHFRLTARSSAANSLPTAGELTVKSVKQNVTLRSAAATLIRVP